MLGEVAARETKEEEVDTRKGKVIKFGWIEGVLMRCVPFNQGYSKYIFRTSDVIIVSYLGVVKIMANLLCRCLLNIWGTMLFLRLTWVVGQCGLWQGLLVITLCNIVTLLSALSMSAISTNGKIAAGGVYYMISRALGES